MIENRIIPILLIKEKSLVKTINFRNYNYIGDPCNTVKIFNELEVDEMIVLDINATKNNQIDFDIISDLASECFMPLSYGGGLKTLKDAERIFRLGIEKIVINSYTFSNLQFVQQLVKEFGSQAIVASVDYKILNNEKRVIFSHSGKFEQKKFYIYDWINYLIESGVGELILTCINREGTWDGFDLVFLKKISKIVKIPIIAHGGAGCLKDIKSIFDISEISAVGLGSLVVYQKKGMGVLVNYPDKNDLKKIFKK